MVLYKNVDVIDLESILSKGILSLNKSGNNNWGDHKRANNSCDVVYLFKPLTDKNSFCNYGTALLEINIPDNDVNELMDAIKKHPLPQLTSFSLFSIFYQY